MNTDAALWLNILDKTGELFRTARSPEADKDLFPKISADLDAMAKMISPTGIFYLVFSGMTNVGKSTLFNALLGDTVAPTKNSAWSSTAVEYQYGESGKYELVIPQEKYRSLHKGFDTSRQLMAELNRFAVEGSIFQTREPLIVRFPCDLLRGGVTIVDTPGFGASDGIGDAPLHDDILLSYLKKRESCLRVFWIVKDNIDETSVAFFKDHLSAFCSDLVVNLTDDDDDGDGGFRDRFEALYKPAVGHAVRFHYINAKSAVRGMKNSDLELQKSSGLTDLKSYLSYFSSPEGRTHLVEKDLTSMFQGISDYLYSSNHYSCAFQPTAWGTLSSLLRQADSPALYRNFSQLEGDAKWQKRPYRS